MKHPIALPGLLLSALWLAACSEPAVYNQESFAADSPFKLKVTSRAATACESVRRALLGQGYLIDEAKDEAVRARKTYKNADAQNTLIEMNVVCIAERKGSTLFATGVMSTYDLKKSNSSASVGVSAIGSISLPFGQSADSLVKIGEETIDDAEFYRRFFSAVTYTLQEIEPGDEPVGEPQTPPVAPQPEQALPATAPKPAPVQEALPLPGTPASAQSAPAPVLPAGTPVAQPAAVAPQSAPSAPVLGTVTTAPQTSPTQVEAVVNPAPSPEAIMAPTTTSEPLPGLPVAQPSPQPDSSPQPLAPQAQPPAGAVVTPPQEPAGVTTAADPGAAPQGPPVTDPAEIFE